jgi:pimeloyl-ACP methyl ester carboxylesterase
MTLRIFKYLFLGAFLLLILLLLIFITGSKMSMDSDFSHTNATKDLPKFSPTIGNGIVNISIGDMTFRARIAGFNGDFSKKVVILLHGFPVTSAMWVDLIRPLEEAGYRVVAFDQRGYSPDARPETLESYTVSKLTKDVFAVADTIGAEEFHLIGHDWGAVVGWSAVLTNPSRITSWTALSIAHPAAFSAALLDDPDQQARSSYFAFFQTPWLPETFFSFNNFSVLKTLYEGMSEEKKKEYIDVFSEPEALTSALNWYRAMGDTGLSSQDSVVSLEVKTPTLFLWGNQDGAVGRVAIDAMAEFMKGPYTNIELEAGHWLFVDKPERIISEILIHIDQYNLDLIID